MKESVNTLKLEDEFNGFQSKQTKYIQKQVSIMCFESKCCMEFLNSIKTCLRQFTFD